MPNTLKQPNTDKVYVYFHTNPVTNDVFYVGIGTTVRAWNARQRNIFWKRTVNKYGGFNVNIVEENLTLDKAIEREKYYIEKFGRRDKSLGTLVNLTDGGEYFHGLIITDEHRRKLSESRLGKPMTDETKIKISISSKGKKLSQEDKDNKSKAALGHTVSEETRNKISKSSMGKSAHNKGIAMSDEQKIKLSLAKTGKSNIKLSKSFYINGIEYTTLRNASDLLGITVSTIYNRLKNPKYDEYQYK